MTGTRRAELVLAGVLVAESAIFALTAPNFATFANAAEIVRLGVEVGLLALALTPIVVTGGIDLSCGALLGLSAVVFGALWRDAGWSPWTASLGALAIGAHWRRAQWLAHRALEPAAADGDARRHCRCFAGLPKG